MQAPSEVAWWEVFFPCELDSGVRTRGSVYWEELSIQQTISPGITKLDPICQYDSLPDP